MISEKGNVVVDHENIARSRLRIDTRKWLLSKLAPKKYGDSLRVDKTLKIEDIKNKSDDELRKIIEE